MNKFDSVETLVNTHLRDQTKFRLDEINNKFDSVETLVNTHLRDQTKFRLDEINKIKDSFNSEIQERKTMRKKLSKYIAIFDYINKTLIVLSATSGGISIISFTSVIGIPARIASANFCFNIFYKNSNNKKTIESNKKKEEKTQQNCYAS